MLALRSGGTPDVTGNGATRKPSKDGEPNPTDLIFPKTHHELFNTILDEENLKTDREGQPRTLTAFATPTSVSASSKAPTSTR